MTLRATLTRLFRAFTGRRTPALSTRDTVRDDLERRARVRQTLTISHACRANGLNNRDRARVFAEFEQLAPKVGIAEARTHARNLAASIANRRRTRLNRPSDPWEPTPPAAAA